MKKLFLIAILLTTTGCVYTTPNQNTQTQAEKQNLTTTVIENTKKEPKQIQNTETVSTTNNSPTIPYPEPEYTNPVRMIVNGETYTIELKDNMTVYDLMLTLSADSKKPFLFETKEYPGMGHFVESINDLKQNPKEDRYWIYYINGESAKVGISNYIINQGDIIEWKYE
ncbi:MAG TPA: hypothetical protein DCS29_00415 [Candidatus Magasanikbacteria bacterium]|nr:MAG: hypothetical protein A2479_03640 [Candidatus Magasanikbacteria bacterium RIFOXYC2_FULL_39_8]HAT03228.1 hypothetical protein [Candidatus Magasanikbacteria bacterium]